MRTKEETEKKRVLFEEMAEETFTSMTEQKKKTAQEGRETFCLLESIQEKDSIIKSLRISLKERDRVIAELINELTELKKENL